MHDDASHARTTRTNLTDNYAHRGDALATTPPHVYRMYVRRAPRPDPAKMDPGTPFRFEPRYDLANTHVQEMALTWIQAQTIDGFSAPVFERDPEQNSFSMTILFSPWACKGPAQRGSACIYKGLLRQMPAGRHAPGGADQSAASRASPPPPAPGQCAFQRARHLRSAGGRQMRRGAQEARPGRLRAVRGEE